jgi:hypothetical protein
MGTPGKISANTDIIFAVRIKGIDRYPWMKPETDYLQST